MGMANDNKRINLTAPLVSVRHHGGNGTEPTGMATVTRLPASSYGADATSGALGRTGAVPFGWERRPGHPKSVRTRRRTTPVPPLTIVAGDDDPKHAAQEPAEAAAAIVVSARAREEEVFSDALSRDDEVSCVTVNCSATTGLSDAAGAPPRARGGSVMMERFLPAAHAVAAGSPQSTFRKATRSPAAASARTGGGDRSPARTQRPLPFQHIAAYHLPPLPPGGKNKEEEENGDDAESDAHSTAGFASRRCGWLPSRCVKSARLLSSRSRRGASRLLLPTGGGSHRAKDQPLLRRSRNGEQQPQHTGDDPGMQSWEEVYIKSLLRSGGGGGGGLMGPAAAVASELDRTVRELYRHRGGQAVQPKPKASHLGLLLVLDRSNEDCGRRYNNYHHGSSAQKNLPKSGDVPWPLPSTRSSPNSGNELGRGVTGDYCFPLLLEDAEAVAGREMALSPTPLLPLPLPASPTESWLSRALPSVSARPPAATSFLGLHVQPKKHAPLPSWCAIDSARDADHDRQRQRRVHDLQK